MSEDHENTVTKCDVIILAKTARKNRLQLRSQIKVSIFTYNQMITRYLELLFNTVLFPVLVLIYDTSIRLVYPKQKQ